MGAEKYILSKHFFLKLILGISLSCCFFLENSCQKISNSDKKAKPSFYYWKSIFDLNKSERKILEDFQIDKLYIKFFDVKRLASGKIGFVAKLRVNWDDYPVNTSLSPTIFLDNSLFYDLAETQIDSFASQTYREIVKIVKQQPYEELQIDCDWSGQTKEKYFSFLKKIKTLFPTKEISSTIRLHQVKYQKQTGIPPIDKGMLMIYNVSNPTKYSDKNSIFEPAEINKYLNRKTTYPLKLDIALPLFSWGIHFENKKFKGFLNKWTNEKAVKFPFLKPLRANFYEVMKDTVINNQYLRRGDEIKVEDLKIEELTTILTNTFPILRNDTFQLTLFHLDEELINNFKRNEINAFFKAYE